MKIISVGFCKDLEELNDSIIEHNNFYHKEYECTWQKPNGNIYKKFLKSRPLDTFKLPILKGSYNQYGHKLLDIESCYIIK